MHVYHTRNVGAVCVCGGGGGGGGGNYHTLFSL